MTTKNDLSDIAKKIAEQNGLIFVADVGRGAFKQTFHVKDTQGTSSALKIYLDGLHNERQAREIDAMKRCNHQNIAKLIQISTYVENAQNYVWLLEEFVECGNLTNRIDQFDTIKFKPFAQKLTAAVEHIYNLDLVHRDIKPDNIMFRADDSPVLVDFGLVRDLNQNSLTATWAMGGPGTPFFAPAEQINNEKSLIDWRADQFSMGVVFSMILFKTHPYARIGDTLGKTINRVCLKEGQSAEFKKRASESGLDFLIKMTEPWPIKRFRTPQDLLLSI